MFSSQTIGKMEAGILQHQLIANGPQANVVEVSQLEQAQLNEVAAQALTGGIINRPFLNDDSTGTSDQHDIGSDRSFNSGMWAVIMQRSLSSGSAFDIDLSAIDTQSYPLGFAVHDSNDGGLSHHVSIPVSIGAGGDIEPQQVADVNAVNWASIPPLQTVLFKPGAMSFEWLDNAHPVAVDADCNSCHFRASLDHGPQGPQPPGSCLNCHTGGRRAAKVWEYSPLD